MDSGSETEDSEPPPYSIKCKGAMDDRQIFDMVTSQTTHFNFFAEGFMLWTTSHILITKSICFLALL